jgi:diguanylate cyclase (GGDEF)-like protein
MLLDIRTLIMITAAFALLIGVCLRYVLRDYPDTLRPSIRLWILGTVLQPTAWMLYYLRDALPDFVTMVFANALLGFAFAKHTQALDTFVGRGTPRALLYAPVALLALCEIVFTYIFPDMRLRVVSATAAYCAQMLLAIHILLHGRQELRRSHLLTACAFAVLAIVLIVRIFYEGLRSGTLSSAFAASLMQTLVFGAAAFFPIIASLGFVLMCSDFLHQELERQARTDPLTGIDNRRTLAERAELALALARRHARPLAVLLVDADHFKRVNDEYGHAAGDEALKMLTAILKSGLRAEDLFGRLGGEEFVIVLPEADAAAACVLAERLRAAVEAADFHVHQQHVALQISIGVSAIEPNDDFAALLRRADQAMYAAKRAGRNRVIGPATGAGVPLPVASQLAG